MKFIDQLLAFIQQFIQTIKDLVASVRAENDNK